jgi:hypothetical protein
MASPVSDSYSGIKNAKIIGGKFLRNRVTTEPCTQVNTVSGVAVSVTGGAEYSTYTGVIALSAQGASDPFALSPPGQFPTYPNGPCGGTYGAKHQVWAFDSDHGHFIVGSGDMTGDSEVDLFTYDAATKQFSPLLLKAAAGSGPSTFDHSITSISITSAGSGYTSGYYPSFSPAMPGVALQGGTGTGAAASIHVSSGAIDSCTIYSSGYGYTVGDVLTVNASDVGGTGSNFAVTVTGISPAGTPSSIIGPVGRCLPGYAYDANRSVLWMESGSPRAGYIYPGGFANNLVKGGLWALDRSVTPPVWHQQGPGVGESAAGVAHGQRYDNYSSGMYFDTVGDALYSILVGDGIYRYPLAGLGIDDVTRDLWTFYSFAPVAGENHGGFHTFDSLRRRIIFWSPNAKKTYAWNCATNTYSDLGSFDPPFNNDYHMVYDSGRDRVILWIAGQYGDPYDDMNSPGYYGDYQGRRTHVMYQMDGSGNWTSFTPVGDKFIEDDCQYAQVSGEYDPVNNCLVLMAGNQTSDANLGVWFSPTRLVVYHLYSGAWPAWRIGLTPDVWSNNLAENTYVTILERNQTDSDFGTYYQQPGSSTVPQVSSTNPWAYASGLYLEQQQKYIFTGGGHDDWLGSEVGVFDMNTLIWTRTDESAKLAYNSEDPSVPFQTIDEVWKAWRNPSGRFAPMATHTYGGLTYLPSLDKVHVCGAAAYRGGNGNPGGATFIDAATGHWDESGAMTMSSAVNCQSHTIPTVYVVNSSLVPTGATITDGVFRVQVGNNAQYWMVDPVGKTQVPHTNYYAVAHNSSCNGCIVPDHLHDGHLAFVTDRNDTTFFYAGYVDYVRNDGGYVGNGEAFAYGNTKPAAIGTGVACTWIYMGNYFPGSTKIAVFRDGVGIYALDTVTWQWSTLLVAAPVAASGDQCVWRRFFYVPEYECFGLFSSYGAEFRAITVPNELK